MKRDTVMLPVDFNTSFFSCEKDTETIIKKLLLNCRPYSDDLKKLLVINAKDCLTNNDSPIYQEKLKEMTISKLFKDGYIRLEPKIRFDEHEEVKAYIILTFDNFTTNATNPQFRDCTVNFDIICHTDYWALDNYANRPLKIAGYIDGILNNSRLSGIGTFNFLGCNQLILDENLSGYSLSFRAVHGSDDKLPPGEEEW